MSENVKNRQLINVSKTKHSGKDLVLITERIEGKKQVRKVKEPLIGFYILNEEARSTASNKKPAYMGKEFLDYYEVPFSELHASVISLIAELDDDDERAEKFISHYDFCINNKKFRNLNAIFRHPYVFGADTDLCDYYFAKWFEDNAENHDATAKLHKSYFDIEVDIIDIDGFPEEDIAPCPVSVVSYVIDDVAYLFLLDLNCESMDNFMKNEIVRFRQEMLHLYGEAIKTELNLKYTPINDLIISIHSTEIELIQSFFNLLFEKKPDTCSAWNLKFDFVTLMNRIRINGFEPSAVMTPDGLRSMSQVFYYEDTYNRDIADKKDTASCTGYTTFLDQMLIFASLRKTMGKRDSYSLDAILEEETNFSKLELDGETLKRLPYNDYYTYAHYSLRDTVGLKILENKVNDIDLIYTLSQRTKTRLEKAFTKTISLRNFALEYNKDKSILKCNPNSATFEDEVRPPAPKFEGAVVADPTKVAPLFSEALGFDSSFIRDNVTDQDFESLYPGIMRAFEIDNNTFLGVLNLDLDPETYDPDNPNKRTKQFVEYAIADNNLQTGVEFFNLPTITEIILGIENNGRV